MEIRSHEDALDRLAEDRERTSDHKDAEGDTILVEEENTIYELDRACARKRGLL